MKSIKKKAEEYAFIKQGIDSVGIKFIELNTNKQDGFEAGANYVLEEIEKLLPKEDNRNLNDYGKALVWRIKDAIKQLKK